MREPNTLLGWSVIASYIFSFVVLIWAVYRKQKTTLTERVLNGAAIWQILSCCCILFLLLNHSPGRIIQLTSLTMLLLVQLMSVLMLVNLSNKVRGFETRVEPESAEKKEEIVTNSYTLSEEELDEVIREVDRALLDDKLFLAPDCSVDKLAAYLQLSSRRISMAVNVRKQQGFSDLLNDYRIDHAVHLLLAEPGMTVKEVMYASGYNSKSAFFNAFKKRKNQTPGQFRKQFLG